MVIAYHVILSMHGFWLPNDPRGSYSTTVHADHLKPFGDATTVTTRRSVAAKPHDWHVRRAAKEAMKRPPVVLTGEQAQSVARGFQEVSRVGEYAVHACAILPQHVHIVLGRHDFASEQVIRQLRQAATLRLVADGRHPCEPDAKGKRSSIWSRGHWSVYLFTPSDVARAVAYVNNNPVRDGKRAQRWPFITPYEG